MASTYTPLGIEKQATGENAGTWGTKTNTNLEIVEQAIGGTASQAVSDSGDTTLSVTDGGTGAALAHRVIEFTGSLTASRNVTIPLDVQQLYLLISCQYNLFHIPIFLLRHTGYALHIEVLWIYLLYYCLQH